MFRTKYRVAFVFSLVFLVLNSLVVFFNKELYLVLDDPKKHFAYNMHVAKELAQELKSREIECVDTDTQMQSRLRFYGVTNCNTTLLLENSSMEEEENSVTISYKNRAVYHASVTNINTD